jgi:hypothetical protein
MGHVMRLAMLALAVAAYAATARAAENCSPQWLLAYRHDTQGAAVSGSKAALFDAIRRGAPVRIGWGMKLVHQGRTISVEHTADPVFLTIVSDKEVVIQLPEHIAQKSYVDPAAAAFDTPSVMWRGLMGSDGTFDAVWVNRATGEEVRRYPQRVGLAWFAFLPPESCARQDALTLATEGGVKAVKP